MRSRARSWFEIIAPMDVVIGVALGVAGIALSVYFAFQTLKAANAQNAATLEALSALRVEVAKVETRTQMTQESFVPLVRSALDSVRSRTPRDAEAAIRQAARTAELSDETVALLTESVRGAVSESLERTETEALDARASPPMEVIAPNDLPDAVAAAVRQESQAEIAGAQRRGGPGAPLWGVDTNDGRHWEVTRTRWGITVYPDART